MPATARLDPRNGVTVHGDQSPADVERRGGQNPAVVDQREFRRTAADVDVEDPGPRLVGGQHGSRTVGGQHGLHVMAGGRAHQVARPLGDDGGDPLGIATPQRLAGEDDHAGVDVLGTAPRVGVRGVQHPPQLLRIDLQIVGVGSQRHLGLEQRLPADHDVSAGQILTAPAQLKPGEGHLRAGAADVDAHAVQRDVVLLPDRVLFDRQLRLAVFVIGVVAHACDGTGSSLGGRSASSAS